MFVHGHSYAKIRVLHDTPPGETRALLSCQPEIDRFTTTILVIESLHGLAVHLIPAFYEIVNVEQQLTFRCFIGREQCEQAFVTRIFFFYKLQPTNPQLSLPSTSLVPTQVPQFLFQHATTVLDPLFDESLLVAVSWQVCFFLDVLRACPNALVKSAMRPVTFADASH